MLQRFLQLHHYTLTDSASRGRGGSDSRSNVFKASKLVDHVELEVSDSKVLSLISSMPTTVTVLKFRTITMSCFVSNGSCAPS